MGAVMGAAGLGVWMLASPAAAADSSDPPTRFAVTVAPLKLLQPRAALELDVIRPDRFHVAGSLSVGRQNGVGMRLNNLGRSRAGFAPLVVRTFGGGISVERFVRAPDRGVYAGGMALVDRYRLGESTAPDLGYSSVRVGPTVGWKGIGDRGLTLSIDAGPAYGGVFALVGYPPLEAETLPRSSFTLLGSLQVGQSF